MTRSTKGRQEVPSCDFVIHESGKSEDVSVESHKNQGPSSCLTKFVDSEAYSSREKGREENEE